MDKFGIAMADLEHIRLHVWELRQMLDRMKQTKNPEAPHLESILERFLNASTKDDRP